MGAVCRTDCGDEVEADIMMAMELSPGPGPVHPRLPYDLQLPAKASGSSELMGPDASREPDLAGLEK